MNQFARLKPLCDALTKHPTVATALDLQTEIDAIEPQALQQLQGYILLPLITIVDTNDERNNQELKQHLIDTISALLRHTRLLKTVPVQVISVVLLKHTFDVNTSTLVANLSEEFKLSVLQCFGQLFRSLESNLLPELYVQANSVLLGQIVFVVLHLIEHERFRKIRIAGVECLMSVFYVHESADPEDLVLRDHVSNHVFVMLPKVVATLQQLVLGDPKQGHELITLSIKALGKILCLIFEDYGKDCAVTNPNIDDFRQLFTRTMEHAESIDPKDTNVLGINSSRQTIEDRAKQMKALKKTSAWLEAAIQKLQFTLENVSKLVGNPDRRVRWEVADMACELIQKSPRTIQSHLSPMLQVLVALTQDEDPGVAKRCFGTLTNVTTCTNAAQHLDQLEHIFHAQLVRLPRIIYAGNENEQMADVLLLNGLLQSLSQTRLKSVLSCAETLDRFVDVLLSLFELDRSMDLLHEQMYAGSVRRDPSLGTPWKRFVNMGTETLCKYAEQLCRIVGRSNAVELIFKYLLDRLVENDARCNEVLVVLQLLLALNGWGETCRIEQCLHEVLAKRHWELDVRPDRSTQLEMEEFGESNWYQDRTEGLYESAISIRYTDVRWKGPAPNADIETISISDAKFNVLHICLILETVGRLGRDLGHAFQPFLLKSLHRVLEKTGSNNFMIHNAGAFALDCLSAGKNYKDVAELIGENADYIAYFVNVALKKASDSKHALDILSVVLRYSSLQSVPHLEGIINTVLDESAKPNQTANRTSFLKVFHMILYGFNRWLDEPESTQEAAPPAAVSEADILQQWLDIIKPSEPDSMDDDSVDVPPPTIDDDDPTEAPPIQLPSHITIACTILKRCIKYISTKNRMDKCLVLDALGLGLNVIRAHENELLPMVHALWPPFAERIRDQDSVVLRKCFGVLVVLGTLAKDFLYKRTATDIFPFILTFLKQTAVKSHQRLHDASFENTQQFKLTLELFGQLPHLMRHLDVTETDLDRLLDHVKPFLNGELHRKALQVGAQQFMVQSAECYAFAVYVKLLDVRNEKGFRSNVDGVLNTIS